MEFFDGDYSEGSLDLEEEKRELDIRFAAFIRDLDLKPARFRKCMKCRKIFYQPTSRGKNYCSPRCAGAVRQLRYIKRKRG